MEKLDNNKYIYGGYIEYQGKKIVIFFDTTIIKNTFFEEVNHKYRELDRKTKIFFDSVFNRQDGIVYRPASIKKIITLGLTAITITLFVSDDAIQSTSLQKNSSYTYANMNELTSVLNDEITNNIPIENNETINAISNETSINMPEKEVSSNAQAININNDSITFDTHIESTVESPIISNDVNNDNNLTTDIPQDDKDNLANITDVGACAGETYTDKSQQIQILNGLTALGYYYNVDDILAAINTNPNITDDEKKELLKLEDFFRSNPYLDYNTVGVNLNTVKINHINDPNGNVGGSYDCNTNMITIYDNETFFHEAVHCAFRTMNTFTITKNENGEIIKKELCSNNILPTNLESNQSLYIQYSTGLSNNEYGIAVGDGMVKLFEQEYTNCRDDVYQAQCLMAQILCEVVGKDIMLEGFSTSNPDLVIEKLTQIYGNEQDAKSLLILIDNYSNAYYSNEPDIIYNTLLKQTMVKFIGLYKNYIEQNISNDKMSCVSLYKVMQDMNQIVVTYLPEKGPLFDYLFNNTKQVYSLTNKDFDTLFQNETGLDIYNTNNMNINRCYYGQGEEDGYVIAFDNADNAIDFITVKPKDNEIKSR